MQKKKVRTEVRQESREIGVKDLIYAKQVQGGRNDQACNLTGAAKRGSYQAGPETVLKNRVVLVQRRKGPFLKWKGGRKNGRRYSRTSKSVEGEEETAKSTALGRAPVNKTM